MFQKRESGVNISDLVRSAPRSGIRDVFDRCAQNPDIISFAVGEPGFRAPAHVARAAREAIDEGQTGYTEVLGIAEFRQAAVDYSTRVKGLHYDPETEIQAVPGATLGLYLALRTLLNPGDEVIVCSPHFTSYDAQIHLSGGTTVLVPLRGSNGMRMDADDIEAAVTERTKVILVNSPSNPTGAVTPVAELERIARVARRHNLWIISDEVYHPFVYPAPGENSSSTTPLAPSIAAVEGMKERTVVVDSLSKTYAMTGWRIGYLLGPAAIIEETSKVAELIHSSNNAPAQYGGAAALAGPQEAVAAMRAQYARNRDVVIEALARCPGIGWIEPAGAFYIFVDVRGTGLSSREFSARLIDDVGVAVVPGEAFGEAGQGYVRLSYAGDEAELAKGMELIVHFARQLVAAA